MKKLLFATALAFAAVLPLRTASAADVGVSVSIGQPGFYGRIDIGNQPPPQIIYPQPVIYAPAPYATAHRPIYLRVPPGHYNNWGKHCARYGACGQPVYFVQDGWYQNVYAPSYREQHYHRDDRRYDRRDDRRDDRRGDRDGPGRGHGKGKGHDK